MSCSPVIEVSKIFAYERLGYVKYKEHEEVPGLKFIYLQK